MRLSNLRSHNILHKKKNPNSARENYKKIITKNFLNAVENYKFILSENISILDSFSKFNDSRNVVKI